jgi:hypothetical protein
MLLELLAVCALLTSAMFYLGSRAVVTSWLWGRYPPRLARFMDCAACSGFWYGLIVGAGILAANNWSEARIPELLTQPWSPLVIAVCSMVWTPIVAGYMQTGFERLGSAVAEDEDEQT